MLPAELDTQEFALHILRTHLQQDRLAHTYLFSGGGRLAQEALALVFAAMVNTADQGEESAKASILRRIQEGNHPDVHWLGKDEKERSIKIDQVRQMIGWTNLKPYEGLWKVFVIAGADRLTVDAQNALLKTLEEPPGRSLFCLLVDNKDPLLDTIRSRAFEVRLKPLPLSESSEDEVPESFGKKRWEDFFEEYQTAPKDELNRLLDQLMARFSELLRQASLKGETRFCDAWLKTIDLLYETKDALEANINQKLALTRLAVQMKRVLPNPQMLKVE